MYYGLAVLVPTLCRTLRRPINHQCFALVRFHAADQQRFARFNEKSLTELNFHFKITQNIVNAEKNCQQQQKH